MTVASTPPPDRQEILMSIVSTAPALALALNALCMTCAAAEQVFVNGVELTSEVQRGLDNAYGTIAPGRYWYDGVSGLWGREGGPAAGQIRAGLKLGGPLRADASAGRTGVFVNGRQLHAFDVAALSQCTQVVPGRYWYASNGLVGIEGGPALFNLAAACGERARSSQGGSSTTCENYGGGRFACGNSNTNIGVIGEGGGKGAVHMDGKVIMTPN
jgi:hypothetical protein